MPLASACSRKSGPVSIMTWWALEGLGQTTAADGRKRRSRGSLEVQTRQSQPSVGTPIEVPLPRMMREACIRKGISQANLPLQQSQGKCKVEPQFSAGLFQEKAYMTIF